MEHPFGIVEAAAHHELMPHAHLVELFERGFSLFGSEIVDVRNLARHLLHFHFSEFAQDGGAVLLAEKDEENGGLPNAACRRR